MDPSLGADYFERLYAASDDPWNFASSPYERAKYELTVAMLGGPYGRGLEIGCSIGVLTTQLAPQFRSLLAVDINERAIDTARKRCAGHSNVAFAQMAVPREFPAGAFDAVVLSEVGYYWSDEDLALAIDRIAVAASGGVLELVHFLPKVDDYVRDGDRVHEAFLADSRLARRRWYRADAYRVDVLDVR